MQKRLILICQSSTKKGELKCVGTLSMVMMPLGVITEFKQLRGIQRTLIFLLQIRGEKKKKKKKKKVRKLSLCVLITTYLRFIVHSEEYLFSISRSQTLMLGYSYIF